MDRTHWPSLRSSVLPNATEFVRTALWDLKGLFRVNVLHLAGGCGEVVGGWFEAVVESPSAGSKCFAEIRVGSFFPASSSLT